MAEETKMNESNSQRATQIGLNDAQIIDIKTYTSNIEKILRDIDVRTHTGSIDKQTLAKIEKTTMLRRIQTYKVKV